VVFLYVKVVRMRRASGAGEIPMHMDVQVSRRPWMAESDPPPPPLFVMQVPSTEGICLSKSKYWWGIAGNGHKQPLR
jgi:hypothetical protein